MSLLLLQNVPKFHEDSILRLIITRAEIIDFEMNFVTKVVQNFRENLSLFVRRTFYLFLTWFTHFFLNFGAFYEDIDSSDVGFTN